MRKALVILTAIGLLFCMTGTASATSYYEAYTGNQQITQKSSDYYFHFDIDLADNDVTNSSLNLTSDATGFDWWNNEQLESLQIQIDLSDWDRQPEGFYLNVDIYWSKQDFTESVTFNANRRNNSFYYTYDFTQSQIDGWENGGWGTLTLDAFNLPGRRNFNDFRINRVALSANSEAATVSLNPVPEPATMVLFGSGLIGLVGLVRRRKEK